MIMFLYIDFPTILKLEFQKRRTEKINVKQYKKMKKKQNKRLILKGRKWVDEEGDGLIIFAPVYNKNSSFFFFLFVCFSFHHCLLCLVSVL